MPTKVHIVKAMDFPVMYGCERWTIKKAECWKTDPFEMWYWRRLLRVSWSAKRSNQSILNIHGRNYAEAEAPIFGHLMQRANSLEKTLMLGKIECRRRGWQRTSWLESITDSVAMSFSKLWEMVKDREAWDAAVHGVTKSWTQLSDWTTTKNCSTDIFLINCNNLQHFFYVPDMVLDASHY